VSRPLLAETCKRAGATPCLRLDLKSQAIVARWPSPLSSRTHTCLSI
jgi:hypothetical protein